MPETPLERLLASLFRRWNEQELPYLVLRNYEQLPRFTSNDVDVLIDPASLACARHHLSEAATEAGWACHNVGEFACWTFFFFDRASETQVHIDLMCGIKWHALVFADHSAMLRRRRPHKGFYIPHPVDEAAVNLMTRLLYAGCVRDKYREQIRFTAGADGQLLEATLSPWLGRDLAADLTRLAADADWSRIEGATAAARHRVLWANLKRPCTCIHRLAEDAMRLVRRLRRPPGLCVLVIGPEDTVAAKVARAVAGSLAATFHPERTVLCRSRQVDVPPACGGRRSAGPAIRMEGRPPVLRTLFRNGLIVFHGAYAGLAQPIGRRFASVRPRASEWSMRAPDVVVLLGNETVMGCRDGDATDSMAGVPAHTPVVERLASLPATRVVDSAAPFDAIVLAVRRVLLDFMVQRAASRVSGLEDTFCHQDNPRCEGVTQEPRP